MENFKSSMMKTILLITTYCIALVGCSARKTEPIKDPVELTTAEEKRGEVLFMKHCQKCHPNGEEGLGPALNVNPAPRFVKAFQIRHGLGVMPGFDKNEISKEDLDNITTYMKRVKHN
jgi:mono/diheme cytochrome c family protein